MMKRNDQTVKINNNFIKEPMVILNEYQLAGGNITLSSNFGVDPLRNQPNLIAIREKSFFERYSNFNNFFYNIVNGNFLLFKEALLFFVDMTIRLSS